MTPAVDALQVLAHDSHMAIVVHGRLFVVSTLRPPSTESMLRFRAHMLRRYDQVGTRMLGVIVPSAPRPGLEDGCRETILDVWHELVDTLDGCAVWIRRDSFVGALQRSLVTGVLLLRPPPMISGVVRTASEAMDVLVRADPSLSPEQRAEWTSVLERFALEYTG